MKRIVALCLTLVLLLSALPMPVAQADSVTLVVTGGWLRLRDEANFNGDTIDSYYTGTKVTVLDTVGGWYYVRTPNGKAGYMCGKYLTSSGTGTSGSTSTSVTAYVTSKNGQGVRLRTGPGTGYGVIDLYSVGTKATILSAGTYWHYISIGGQKGYMMAQYLTTKAPSSSTTPDTDTDTDTDVVDYTAYVTSDNGKSVRLRKGPGTGYTAIGSYAVGTQVTVSKVTGSWSKISVAGVDGYMMSKYLTTTKPGSSDASTEETDYTAYVTSDNGKAVRMRKGPGTSYATITSYNVGTQVTVTAISGSWSKIKVGTQTGYMMSKYLTTTKPSTGSTDTSSTYTAYVTSENGKGVYMRAGAGKNYATKGLFAVGTQVTVLQHNSTWDKIRIGSLEGYMQNKYLTTVKPGSKAISGVTISDAYPAVGETLWANVEPSGANVTYEWMTDNGLLLATTASLKLKEDDVGLRIRVRVTGTNGYTGSAVSSFATVQKAGVSTDELQSLKTIVLDNVNPTVGQTITAGLTPTGATAAYKWMRGDGTQVGNAKAYTVQKEDVGFALWCEATGTGNYIGTVEISKTSAVKDAPADKPFSGTVSLASAIMPGVTLTPAINVNCENVTYCWYAGGTQVGTAKTLQVTQDMAGKEIKLVVKPAAGSGYTGQVESNVCTVLSSTATPTDL